MVNKILFVVGFIYGENTFFETEDNMVPSKPEKISFLYDIMSTFHATLVNLIHENF
jgi:hypothetical protein